MVKLAQPGSNREGKPMRRDIGTIGLLFAGVGSIIGSGWLFGALNASTAPGPSEVFSGSSARS